MHSDGDPFYLKGILSAFENGALVAEREWDETVVLDLVWAQRYRNSLENANLCPTEADRQALRA
jgi:hypothetical protein